MYTKAGVKDEGVMFLFTDGQITNEKFLVFINDLLASGDIADLYAQDEKDASKGQSEFSVGEKLKADCRKGIARKNVTPNGDILPRFSTLCDIFMTVSLHLT